jgi:outer membrane protein TolC
MRRLTLILLAAALAAPAGAFAQEASPTLTLDDAIHLALQRNKTLKVSSYGPGIARANLLVARGAFDPNLVFSRTYNETQFPTNLGLGLIGVTDQTKTDVFSGGVQGLLPIGTVYNVYGSSVETRDVLNGITKNYQTFGGFSVTQPLLRGFGLAANLEQVRIQKANRSISDQAYRQSAINTVTSVIIAYSNLQFAHDELESAEGARARANRLLTENEKKYKVGSSSQSDVIESRANASQYEEDIIIAERAVRDDQNALRELIGEDVFFENEPLFVLAPMELPDITIDRKADLERAFMERPDYQIARLGISQDHAVESHARNGLLPEVDFQGGYGYNGSATNFSPSRQMVEDHMNPSVSAGIVVTIPLTFAVGRGTLRSARLTREKDEEDLRRLAADIAVQVATADGQIEATRRRVEADRATYALAKQALEAEEKKNKAGTGSTYIVVQYQQSLAIAENSISSALAAERQAIATYDATLGTTLERYHVKLAAD